MKRAILAAILATVTVSTAGCVDLSLPATNSEGDAGPDSQPGVGTPRPDVGGPPPLIFRFDSSNESWRLILESHNRGLPEPEWTDFKALSPSGALKVPVKLAAKGDKLFVGIEDDSVKIGLRNTISRITFNLWLPVDHKIGWAQAFIFGFNAPMRWQSVNTFQVLLRPGDWTTFVLDFPDGYEVAPGLTAIGFELNASAEMDGTAFIDDVVVEFVAR